MTHAPIRVLLTKIGLDGHDRGIRLVATGLKNAGMEVILTPPWMKIDEVVWIALQEDVDVIGISSLSCDHLILPKLMDRLRESHMSDVVVVVGGIIPKCDVPALMEAGVAAIFHPGSSLENIANEIRSHIAQRRPAAADAAAVAVA